MATVCNHGNLTLFKNWTNQKPTSHHELPINAIGVWIRWELKEQRSGHSCGWSVLRIHLPVSLVEQGVVVGQKRVANAKHFAADGSH